MKLPAELRAACAVNAAVIGASFSSGREAASFFACAGWASWPAIAISAALFGLLMGMICHFAIETGARDMPEIYYRKLDARCGDAIGAVHAILMLMMGAVALSTAGELGMLSLNGKHPYLIAAALAVAVALIAAMGGLRPLSALGLVLTPVFILFFAALALDPRPAQAGTYLSRAAVDIKGNFPVAALLGALFACLKAAMACGVAAANSRGLRPHIFGLMCASLMALTAASINWALQRAGESVWNLNLPSVVLAARWGVFGYYVCIFVMWAGSVAVLSCALSSLMSLFSAQVSRLTALLLTAVGVIMMSVTGLRSLVSVGYPLLGWICALCLCALAFFYERRKGHSAPALKSVR
jgi:uncharacterized membrane protein YkvI